MIKKIILIISQIFLISNINAIEIESKNIEEKDLRKFFIASTGILSYSSYHERNIKNEGYKVYTVFDFEKNGVSCKKQRNQYVAIDHEGGLVNRIKSDLLAANKFKNNEEEELKKWDRDIKILKENCINLIMGPVIDPYLWSNRSYSKNIEENIKINIKINNIIESNGSLGILKHFPGALKSCKFFNKRNEMANCVETEEELLDYWLVTKEKINNFKLLMIGNYVYKNIDEKNALLSEKMYKIIKEDLGFRGLIVTDALVELNRELTDEEFLFLILNADLISYYNPMEIEKVIKNILPKINADEKKKKIIKDKLIKINNILK